MMLWQSLENYSALSLIWTTSKYGKYLQKWQLHLLYTFTRPQESWKYKEKQACAYKNLQNMNNSVAES